VLRLEATVVQRSTHTSFLITHPSPHGDLTLTEEPLELEESALIKVRREKLARIVELGYDAFPTKADVDTIKKKLEEAGAKVEVK